MFRVIDSFSVRLGSWLWCFAPSFSWATPGCCSSLARWARRWVLSLFIWCLLCRGLLSIVRHGHFSQGSGYSRRLLFAVLCSPFLLRRWLPLRRRSTRRERSLLLSRLKEDERRETVVLTGTMLTFREELSEPYDIMCSAWEKIRL